MEKNTKKSVGVEIPKRKRSLDLKSIYKSRVSEVGVSKKENSERNHVEDVEKKKRRSRKEVSSSSGKDGRNDGVNAEKSENVSAKKSSGGRNGLHEIPLSLGDNAAVFNIPKRPRGSVGRKMLETAQNPQPLRLQDSNDRVGSINVNVIKSEVDSGSSDKIVKALSISDGIPKLKTPRSRVHKKPETVQLRNPGGISDSKDCVGPINVDGTKSDIDSGSNDKLITIFAGNDSISKLKSVRLYAHKKLKTVQLSNHLGFPDSDDHVGPNNVNVTESEISLVPNEKPAKASKLKPPRSLGSKRLESDHLFKPPKLHDSVDQVGTSNLAVTKSEDISGPNDKICKEAAIPSSNDSLSELKSMGKGSSSRSKSKKKADPKSSFSGSSSRLKLKRKADEVTPSRNDKSSSIEREDTLDVNNGHRSPKKRKSNQRKKIDNVVVTSNEEASTKKIEPSVGEVEKSSNSMCGAVEQENNVFVYSRQDRRNKSRKKKDLLVGGDGNEFLAEKTQPSVSASGSGSRFVDFLDDDDEENLEQNAARMLSSRFDPSCTGFSFPSSSALNIFSQQDNSSGYLESAADDKNIALRPRGEDQGKQVPRQRRHFYEIRPNDLDTSWFLNRRIKIFWPLDESWYHGLVKDYHPEIKLYHIKYDDRDEEWVDLEEEKFKLLLFPSEVPEKLKSRKRKSRNKDVSEIKKTPELDADSCSENSLDTEPIASWLARSTQSAKSLPVSLKKQRTSPMNLPVVSDANTARSNPDCQSALADDLVDDDAGFDKSLLGTTSSSQNGIHFVYVRKKCKGHVSASVNVKARASVTPFAPAIGRWKTNNEYKYYRGCVESGKKLWSIDRKGKLKFNVMLTELRFWTNAAVVPFLEFLLGTSDFWLLHNVFMLQHGVLVTTSPAVKLEMLLIDSKHGLRFVIFEGCLKQVLAFVFLILVLFKQLDEQWNVKMHSPVTSIRFRLFSVQDLRKHMDFAFYSSSGLQSSKWLYLDSKLLQHCHLVKHLHFSECTHGNIKDLDCCSSEHFKDQDCIELSKYKFQDHGALPSTKCSEIGFQPVRENYIQFNPRSVTIEAISAEQQVGTSKMGLSTPEQDLERSEPIKEVHEQNVIFSLPSAPSSMGRTSNSRRGSRSSGLIVDIPFADHVDKPFDSKGYFSRRTSNAGLVVNDGFLDSPNPIEDPAQPDGTKKFVPNVFSNGPKKPRTRVLYTLPFAGSDYNSKQKNQNQRALPCKRIRRASIKRVTDSSCNKKNLESVVCIANVLVTQGDIGWRECDAQVVLEIADRSEWMLAVKFSGITKYSYKVKHIFPPGSTNRFSHAMMWKGGKDWVLEFPDRSQWMLFKEIHEECYNRNIRAASVKNIPIPGVQLIEENDDNGTEVPFVRNSIKYFRQVQTDAELAMDPSRVLYDLDSDDEQWLKANKKYTDISEEFLEKTIDMFEKVSCNKKQDNFTDAEIEDLVVGIGSAKAAKLIYEYWRQKREKKGMPLIRHLQPPLWERYQQKLKDWEHTVAICRGNGSLSVGSHEKVLPPEKPPMFAFCLKPRGLDVLNNRGSKQRSHKKFHVSGHRHAASGDPNSHLGFGRRSSRHASSSLHEYSDVSPQLQASMKENSPSDSHFSLSPDASDWNPYSKIYKNKPKKLGSYRSFKKQQMNSKKPRAGTNRNPEMSSHYYKQGMEQLDGSGVLEFRLREAASESKRALKIAKRKRERAQRLHNRADLSIHKAAIAIMTAEAIKSAYENSNGQN